MFWNVSYIVSQYVWAWPWCFSLHIKVWRFVRNDAYYQWAVTSHSLSLLHMVPLKGASSRRLSVCERLGPGFALSGLLLQVFVPWVSFCVSACTDAQGSLQRSVLQALLPSCIRDNGSLCKSTFQWAGRSLLVEGRQPACPRDFGAQSCHTCQPSVAEFGEAVFWSRSLCSSLKGFFKTVHFLARF